MYWQNAKTTTLKTLVNKPRLGLITDMDGTISPIVANPDSAQVTPRNQELLRALHRVLPLVAVVSGRAARDVQAHVGLSELTYIGNHGFERWINGRVEPIPKTVEYRSNIEAALDDIAVYKKTGMRVEDKGITISVHYRQVASPQTLALEYLPIMEQIAARHQLNLYQGRMVFEMRPPLKINKGTALQWLVTDYKLDAAIYLGDDTTDVDAFQMAQQLREQGVCYALAMGVDSEEAPDAVRDNTDLLVSEVSGVESFLAWLLESRRASTT